MSSSFRTEVIIKRIIKRRVIFWISMAFTASALLLLISTDKDNHNFEKAPLLSSKKAFATTVSNLVSTNSVFIANHGQRLDSTLFTFSGKKYSALFNRGAILFAFRVKENNQKKQEKLPALELSRSFAEKYNEGEMDGSRKPGWDILRFQVHFIGAKKDVHVSGKCEREYSANYVAGNDPELCARDVPWHDAIRYESLYTA